MYQHGSLQWIESAGGPLILLPQASLADWSGYNPDEELSGEVTIPGTTDYERACAVALEGLLGLVQVADIQALVLGDEPMSTAWHPTGPAGGLLIRWVYGDDINAVPSYVTDLDAVIWTLSGITLTVTNQPYYLFDSAWAGQETTERLEITLTEGRYEIDTGIAHPANRTELLLHRFRLV